MYTIDSAIQDFLRHCKNEKYLSDKTLKAYAIDLAQFNSFFNSDIIMDLKNISKVEMRQFLESLSSLKPKSVKRKMATIKAMFNYMEFDEQISINPVRKMRFKIKEGTTIPKVMNLNEIGKILKILYERKRMIQDLKTFSFFEALRNIVIVELLFATGARVSEIASLKTDQLNVSNGEIMIYGKGKRERIIHVCNIELLNLLRFYKTCRDKRVSITNLSFFVNRFNNEISTQSIRLLINSSYKEAGIKRHITPHVFRHSFATLLLEKDVDIKYIQEMLGHSSIAITQIYTHVNKAKQRQLLKSKHPRKDLSFQD